MSEQKIVRQKAKSKGFAALGIPVGAVLTYRKDSTITATVVDEKNKVEYNGKVYPISGLAKELMKATAISGYHAFKYNNVLLAKIGEPEKEKAVKPEPKQADPVPGATTPSQGPQVIPVPQEDIDPLKNQPA